MTDYNFHKLMTLAIDYDNLAALAAYSTSGIIMLYGKLKRRREAGKLSQNSLYFIFSCYFKYFFRLQSRFNVSEVHLGQRL